MSFFSTFGAPGPEVTPDDRPAVQFGPLHPGCLEHPALSRIGTAVGYWAAPNLTSGRGGLGASFTDADWVRAIRHGVHRDGTTLLVMPSEAFVYMNEPDTAALIAYLERLPPVDREMPSSRLGPLGRTLLVVGRFSILTAEKTPALGYPEVVDPAPTASQQGA